MTHCRYFNTTRKGNHSATLIPTLAGGRRPLPSEICNQSDPPPSKKYRLRQISAYNVSTVRDSENSSIMTNIMLTTGFPMNYKWSTYITPKRIGVSECDFFVLKYRNQLQSNTTICTTVQSFFVCKLPVAKL